jgi:voltage-gated potassium channel
MNPLKRLLVPAMILLIIAVIGTLGYTLIEGWSLLDSFYMLVITLFTVGFGEVHPLSPAGRILTMAIIISGVSAALYFVGQFGEIIVEGQLFGYRRRKRMERKLKEMRDHYIICGFGRVGHQVARDLDAENIPMSLLTSKRRRPKNWKKKGSLILLAMSRLRTCWKTPGSSGPKE